MTLKEINEWYTGLNGLQNIFNECWEVFQSHEQGCKSQEVSQASLEVFVESNNDSQIIIEKSYRVFSESGRILEY